MRTHQSFVSSACLCTVQSWAAEKPFLCCVKVWCTSTRHGMARDEIMWANLLIFLSIWHLSYSMRRSLFTPFSPIHFVFSFISICLLHRQKTVEILSFIEHALCTLKSILSIAGISHCMHVTVAFDYIFRCCCRCCCSVVLTARCRLCNFFYRYFSCDRRDIQRFFSFYFFLRCISFLLSLFVFLVFLLSFIDEREPHDKNATKVLHSRGCRRQSISQQTERRRKKNTA